MSATAQQQTPLSPVTAAAFRNRHRGETIVVCGCGESLTTLADPRATVTIGTNDVGRLFTPDYLVVVNPPSQFRAERWPHVEQSRAGFVFSQLDLPLRHAPLVRFRLGRFGGAGFEEPDILHYTQNSPYVGVALAMFMGASRIGLIGVDFTDHHFFATSGPHPLARRLAQIDGEYARLREACTARRIELVNLSESSRLTALPRASLQGFLGGVSTPRRRVFFVNYQFLACGDVFTQGLRRAAAADGIDFDDADWNDADLPGKVARFGPDLLFVVHGRQFVRRWGSRFSDYTTAVWLVDEPYEVDDSSVYSRQFTHVFVNDPSTLGRHRNAAYLPVCFDPLLHQPGGEARPHMVGFIGGANPTRERYLTALAQRGALSYVVGGPWTDPRLKALCHSRNITPDEAAALYRASRIIVNVFRDRHHFNRDAVTPLSLNPRVYEALACGALVVSEWRPELQQMVPDMPVFRTEAELVAIVGQLLADPDRAEALRVKCAALLASHTYADRLRTVMETTLGPAGPADSHPAPRELPAALHARWIVSGRPEWTHDADVLTLTAVGDGSPGSECGIATRDASNRVDLSFDLFMSLDACFIAKIYQADPEEQKANSYHLFCSRRATYLARHNHVFRHVDLPRHQWIRLRLTAGDGMLTLSLGGRVVHRVHDAMLTDGYAALTVKHGSVRLRDVQIATLSAQTGGDDPIRFHHLHGRRPTPPPRVSIVTTVYDRTDCLRRCLQSVKQLQYRNFEQIVVSDAPAHEVVDEIARIVAAEDDGRLQYFNLEERANNWGITPAAVGLRRAARRVRLFSLRRQRLHARACQPAGAGARPRPRPRLRVQLLQVCRDSRARASGAGASAHRSRAADVPARTVRSAPRRRSAVRRDCLGLGADRHADQARRALEARRRPELHLPPRSLSASHGG